MLTVTDLAVTFAPQGRAPTAAVRGVSLSLSRGETLGLVGESGCGKSVTALSLLRLIDKPGRIERGSIVLDGDDLLAMPEKRMRHVRGRRIAWVPQDPLTSLNPVFTVGSQMIETIRAHRKISASDAREEAADWLKRVRIPNPAQRLRQYPHELSGGMRQRIALAMAFSLRPEVLIADEPTTALDMTVQAQVLNLMDELQAELGTAIILITHDLAIVAERADRVAVMYAGVIVETASTARLFEAPRHPYTQALLKSLPRNATAPGDPLPYLDGQPPRLSPPIAPRCQFAPRCDRAMPACVVGEPALAPRGEHDAPVRCILYNEGE